MHDPPRGAPRREPPLPLSWPRHARVGSMRIAVLPGDGIGPEIMAVTVDALARLDRRFGLGLRLEPHDVGLASLARAGSTLPDAVLEACRAADGLAPGPQLRGPRALRAHADGSGNRAREYRGVLCRPQHAPRPGRVHAHTGSRPVGAQGERAGFAAHRAHGLPARAKAPPEGHRGA